MEVEIKQKDSPQDIEKKLKAFSKNVSDERKARVSKFFGAVKLADDPLTLQRKWRDEW